MSACSVPPLGLAIQASERQTHMRELQFVMISPKGQRNVLTRWFMDGEDPHQRVSYLNVKTTGGWYGYDLRLMGEILLTPGCYIVLEDMTEPPWPTPIEFI